MDLDLDPDPLVRGTDPHQNVTPNPQHCLLGKEKMSVLDRTLGSAFIKSDSGPHLIMLIKVRLI